MRPAPLLLVLLPIIVLGGCGGGGGERLTKAEYAAKADAICAKGNQQTKALPNPSNLSELADVADKTIPILDEALGDLRKLRPPADEQETADQWLSAVESLREDLAEIRDRAEDGDLQGVQAIVPQAQRHNTQSNALATQLGMRVCNTD